MSRSVEFKFIHLLFYFRLFCGEVITKAAKSRAVLLSKQLYVMVPGVTLNFFRDS